MRNKVIFLSSLLLLAAACGGPTQQANTSNSAAANANSMAAVPVNPANIPPEFQAAANSAVTGNAAVKPPTVSGEQPKTIEIPGKEGPAPDDSDVKTELRDNLVRTRTFHSNPTIAKVEMTTILAGGTQRSVTKVYLKNGQVKEIDLKDALSCPAADILKAVH